MNFPALVSRLFGDDRDLALLRVNILNLSARCIALEMHQTKETG